MQLVVPLEHEQVGDVRVGHVRQGVEADAHDAVAGKPVERADVTQQGRSHRGRLQDRLREGGAARLLEEQDEVDLVETQAPVRLGHGEAHDAHPRELVPQLGRAAGSGSPHGAHVRGRALLLEHLAHRVAEEHLVVGELEAHVSSAGARERAPR